MISLIRRTMILAAKLCIMPFAVTLGVAGLWFGTDPGTSNVHQDTVAIMAITDAKRNDLCNLFNATLAQGYDRQFLIDHGTASYQAAFNPTQVPVDHMRATLEGC